MKRVQSKKAVKIGAWIVFILLFVILNSFGHIIILSRENQEKLKASYTAETTVGWIESQLNQYLAKAELMKQVLEAGSTIDDEQFYTLAEFMEYEHDAVEGIGLAPNGTVTQYYKDNAEIDLKGMDLFRDFSGKENAVLAKESREYVIAGALDKAKYENKILILDPIYVPTGAGETSFWGFSVLLINRDKMLEGLQLERLEKMSYCYEISRDDPATGKKVLVTQCRSQNATDILEIESEAANTTWYVAIALNGGWFSRKQTLLASLLCFVLAGLMAQVYYQSGMRRYKERIYAEKMQASADEARAANAAKTGFLSRMSHDIRTPLNGIIGLLEIDEKHPDDRELIQQNRGKMLIAANHLLALINDVLQMSKMENGETVLSHEVINLRELARDIITIMEQRAVENGITLEYDSDTDQIKYPFVYGSPLHLRQMFLNIYGNCIKYNNPGGKVSTEFHYLGEKDGKVIYQWIITDTGIGMSEEFVAHIFEPFAQERTDARSVYNGTGLGMAIVKALIERMDGTIEVQSQLGVGSTFVLTIPFEIAKEEDMEPVQVVKEADIAGIHLLLAEDNELNTEIAEMLFTDEGATIERVCDGQQALDTFLANPPGTFDVILMDIMMPVLDGIAATKAIRAQERPDAKNIPIIAMTANAFEEDAKRCVEAGMNAHLSKPLQMQQVIRTIRMYCGEKK